MDKLFKKRTRKQREAAEVSEEDEPDQIVSKYTKSNNEIALENIKKAFKLYDEYLQSI